MNQKRDIPLFIIDSSRSHGRGRENPKDHQAYMVGCILAKIKKDYSDK